MIRLVLAVLLALATAALGAFLALNPGQASFEFLGQRWDMPFVLAAGGILVIGFVTLVIWWGIYLLWTSPDKMKAFLARRRREHGYDALEKALIASAAGDGETAVRQAARADTLLERPALSRLLAARASEAAGNLDAAQAHYDALLEDPRTRLVARRGLTQIARERGDHATTAEHARDAFEQARHARWAFDALFDAQVADTRWTEAAATLREGEKRGHIPQDRARRRGAVVLTAAALAIEVEDGERARDLALSAHKLAHGFAPAAALAARLLAEGRRHKRAAEVLETAWSSQPHPALAQAYRDLRKSDSKAKRLERLKAFAELNPEHRESRLILLQVALEQADAATARSTIAPLVAAPVPSSRVCALAARLARLEGADEEAKRWMTRASHAPTEADWSDIDPDGRLFAYTSSDWKRMVYVYGDEQRLTHPRYERFENYAGAVPETALLEAPRPTTAAASRVGQSPSFVSSPRPPDDPGVQEDDVEARSQ
ncbi:heme biosynthesis HemY N-terminal domain-containing protein [Maricaulis sp. CAU 1757]